ncbi:hypothetical protein ACVME8_008804 [Bradyrhizobium diazoefficiens]
MARIIVYRTDSRDFEPGEEITSRGDHRDELPDEDKKEAEDAIRASHTDGATIRADSLYAYRSLELAKSDWRFRSKVQRHVYELDIDESDIVHVGDLMIYFAVIADVRARRDPMGTASKYWTAAPSEKDTEYLVRKATVVRQIHNASDWKSPIKRAVEARRDDPENEEFYKSIFKDPEQK